MKPPGQVATLILPGDTAWDEGSGPANVPEIPQRARVSEDAVNEAARVLRTGEPAVLLLAGLALREKGLELAARIAANSGCRLLAQTFNRRMERGAGRVPVDRIPYPVEQALKTLAGLKHIVLVGSRIPMATGAAVACPDRKVLNLEADGSAMYTIQALWTQARENLDVTTMIFNNRSYAILRQELANVGAQNVGRKALDMLDLSRPDLDFVGLARGMGVPGERVDTMDDFNKAVARGLAFFFFYLVGAIRVLLSPPPHRLPR